VVGDQRWSRIRRSILPSYSERGGHASMWKFLGTNGATFLDPSASCPTSGFPFGPTHLGDLYMTIVSPYVGTPAE
jgi:hypothetical protein